LGRADDAAHGQAGGVGLDVQHHRLQACGLGQALAVLHAVLAGGGDQHLDIAHRRGAGADDAEVQADLVQRERDVLVGLGLDLQFQLFFAQAGRQHDLLGDHGRLRHGHHHLLGLGAALGHHTAHGGSATSSNFSIWPSVIQPFSKGSDEALEMYSPDGRLPQFHQLGARRADVQPDHRRMLAARRSVKKAHAFPKSARTVADALDS
jgi:hypothetical protein